MQIFKKKNLWLLIPELLKAKDVRQSLSVLEVILDNIRENLVLANLISDIGVLILTKSCRMVPHGLLPEYSRKKSNRSHNSTPNASS